MMHYISQSIPRINGIHTLFAPTKTSAKRHENEQTAALGAVGRGPGCSAKACSNTATPPGRASSPGWGKTGGCIAERSAERFSAVTTPHCNFIRHLREASWARMRAHFTGGSAYRDQAPADFAPPARRGEAAAVAVVAASALIGRDNFAQCRGRLRVRQLLPTLQRRSK